MKKNLLKNRLLLAFAFVFTLVLLIVCAVAPNGVVYAEESPTIKAQLSVSADGGVYYLGMYLSDEQYDESAEYAYYYNINGTWMTAVEEGSFELRTPDTNFSVYGKITVTKNGVMTEYFSDTIAVSPYGTTQTQSEEEPPTTTAAKVVNIALPIVLAIVSIVLLLVVVLKEKTVHLRKILCDVNDFGTDISNLKSVLKDEKITNKKKTKIYKKRLQKIEKTIYGDINNLITLNIDSMGQHNSLLSSMVELENIIKASSKMTALNDAKILIKNCNRIVKKVLPSIQVNAEESYNTYMKTETARQSMFTQHVKTAHSLDNVNKSKEYLEKTLYNGQDDDGDDD